MKTTLIVTTLMCLILSSGCVSTERMETLEVQLGQALQEIDHLKKNTPNNSRLNQLEEMIADGDAECTALAHGLVKEVENKADKAEVLSGQATRTAALAEKAGLEALGTAQNSAQVVAKLEAKTEALLQGYQSQLEETTETLHAKVKTSEEKLSQRILEAQQQMMALDAGYKKLLEDVQAAFETRLLGTEHNFQNQVAILETQLRGKEAELAALVDQDMQEMSNEVAKFRTELLGRLMQGHEHMEKVRAENEGYKATLTNAQEQMKTLQAGFRKELEDEMKMVDLLYKQNEREFQSLKNRVDLYGKQLTKVRDLIAAMLGELDHS
ncbi:hypothetical protein ACFL3F_00170 [Planctomycetota bacterium]